MKVSLRVVLKSGVVLGPVTVPLEEVDALRAMVWPDGPVGRGAPAGGVVHLSSGEDEPGPLWLLSFERSSVEALQAEAVFEPGELEALRAGQPAQSRDVTGTCADPNNPACSCPACELSGEGYK